MQPSIGEYVLRPVWASVPWFADTVVEAIAWDAVGREPVVAYTDCAGRLLAIASEARGLVVVAAGNRWFVPDGVREHERRNIRQEYILWYGADTPLTEIVSRPVAYLDRVWDIAHGSVPVLSPPTAAWWAWETVRDDGCRIRFLARAHDRGTQRGVLWLTTEGRGEGVLLDAAHTVHGYFEPGELEFKPGEVRRLDRVPATEVLRLQDAEEYQCVLGAVITPPWAIGATFAQEAVRRDIAMAVHINELRHNEYIEPRRPSKPPVTVRNIGRRLVSATEF